MLEEHGAAADPDAIVELDWCVGELVKGIDAMGLGENTLFIFCSDNGPVMDDGYADGALEKVGDHRAAGPYTGGKYSIYESGTRTPFITRWTGRIKPGQVSDKMVCTIDLATSFSNYIGAKIPKDGLLDSLDVMGALLGQPDAKGRPSLVQQNNNGLDWKKRATLGYRKGNWKLLRHDGKKARNVVVEQNLANVNVPQYQLFNLANDPKEQKNVFASQPAKAAEMKAELDAIITGNRTRE